MSIVNTALFCVIKDYSFYCGNFVEYNFLNFFSEENAQRKRRRAGSMRFKIAPFFVTQPFPSLPFSPPPPHPPPPSVHPTLLLLLFLLKRFARRDTHTRAYAHASVQAMNLIAMR